jgi:predicted DNA-binding antitoxin AbrB/MazE fold protein
MRTTKTYPEVRAVHYGGMLRLLDVLELPEGAQVRLSIESVVLEATEKLSGVDLMFPTRLVPAERLDALTALVDVGGDALSDSEALYDPDWD